MKAGIHKRLYNVLPVRPRPYYTSSTTITSTSLPLSFFDSPPPPPPPSRLPSRIPTEHKHQFHPNPLALTPSPLTDQDYPQFYNQSHQYQSLSLPSSTSASANSTNPTTTSSLPNKPTRIRYQLDVGAYGIPKHCRTRQRSFHTDDSTLAVSIGEDAYFIRDNAMGVADGVGGWARNCLSTSIPLDSPSPSALFARRLMHYTSTELSLPSSTRDNREDCDSESELESHLSELSEGIDVLQILERAYERTINAHVQPQHNTPLHTGSSTALVAVLDHVHVTPDEGTLPTEANPHSSTLEQNSTGSSTESRDDPEVKLESPTSPVPVVKIAHIGDCMGMLVRGEEIVWRSEEMWWAVCHFHSFHIPI
jgi:serine/threonine protein phosphatase PrpC